MIQVYLDLNIIMYSKKKINILLKFTCNSVISYIL